MAWISPIKAFGAAVALLLASATAQAEPVCAEVKIEILQQVSLERQAFDATMRINNGLEGISVEDIRVEVRFEDEAGRSVPGSSNPDNTNAVFFVRLDEQGLSNIPGGVDGSGRVAPQTVGEARWLIVPSAGAGGDSPTGRIYRVGARVTYRIGDEDRVVDVTPEVITVRPQPILALDYFLPRHVFGDDPFTPEQEPPEPFTLGLRVSNIGHGPARRVRVDSGQPRIVENEQGLLVDFEIIGSSVDDQPGSPSLSVDLGDIEPEAWRTARWRMVSSLNGRFVEFNASYTHAPELGGALTSLLERVDTHTLVHEVLVDLPGRDAIVDFLAYTQGGDFLRVYESDGAVSDVTDVSSDASAAPLGGGGFTLAVPDSPGFSYARVPVSVQSTDAVAMATRANGTPVPAHNVWLSKEQSLDDQSYTYFLNLFDTGFSGSYTVATDAAVELSSLSGFVYLDLESTGDRQPGDPGMAGAVVTLSGVQDDGFSAPSRTVTTDATGGFQFPGLATGLYSLHIAEMAGWVNGSHAAGTAGGEIQPDGITAITVSAGLDASGYLLAKRDRGPEDGADVAVRFDAIALPEGLSDPFELNVVVSNHGPRDSREIQTDLGLPEHVFIESADVTAGAWDSTDGRWSLPDLEAGAEATLALRGRLTRTGVHRFTALSLETSGAGFDPDEENNNASFEMTLDPWSAQATVSSWARVLVFDRCVLEVEGDERCLVPEDVAVAERLAAYLSTLGAADVEVIADAERFFDALTGGDWNVVWIRDGADALGSEVVESLRFLLLRGGRVLASAPLQDATPALLELLAAGSSGEGSEGAFAVVVPEGMPFEPGMHQAFGVWHPLVSSGGSVLATFSSGDAAVIRRHMGFGQVLTAGFDVLAEDTGAVLAAFEEGLARFLQPSAPTRVDADGIVVVDAEVLSGIESEDVTLEISWPGAHAVLAASPEPAQREDDRVVWTWQMPSDDSALHKVEFLAPEQPGTTTLDVTATRAGGVAFGSEQLELSVMDVAAMLESAEDDIGRFEPASAQDEEHQIEALGHVDAAAAHFAAHRYRAARQSLVGASDAVARHSANGNPRASAWEALAFAYRVVRRLDIGEDPSCPIDNTAVRILDTADFVQSSPATGVEVSGMYAPAVPWLARGGVLSSPWASLGAFVPKNNGVVYFEYQRSDAGAARLRLWNDDGELLDLPFPVIANADALLFEAQLDNALPIFGPPQRARNTRLEVRIDRVNGVELNHNTELFLGGPRSHAVRVVVPAHEPLQSVTGHFRPRFGAWVLTLPSVTLRVVDGNVRCEESP